MGVPNLQQGTKNDQLYVKLLINKGVVFCQGQASVWPRGSIT